MKLKEGDKVTLTEEGFEHFYPFFHGDNPTIHLESDVELVVRGVSGEGYWVSPEDLFEDIWGDKYTWSVHFDDVITVSAS